jgi:hypothetical protein
VTAGTVLIAWAATVELRIADGLVAFERHAFAVLAVALLACSVLWLAGLGLEPLGNPVRSVSLLLLFWPTLWVVLRFGLPRDDRQALGSVAQRLRLI